MEDQAITAEQVLEILAEFSAMSAEYWLEGGWGVDAIIGRQTRPHNDIDICFDTHDETRLIERFEVLGFRIIEDVRPTRFVLKHPDRREIDMHPVVFDETGVGLQLVLDGVPFVYPRSGFTSGTINGQAVSCISAERLVAFHMGYEPDDNDRHNMRMLKQHLGIQLPESYRD
jgi:lincosamide nucleotidyltransferase A/C/D/E